MGHYTDTMQEEDQIILVVQGRQITVRRSALALVSKFFRALFSHQFQDSKKRVLHLDPGGQMGLTNSAVQILADFAQTKEVKMDSKSAVQLFIAADALDVEIAREEAETFLGKRVLKPDKAIFLSFWQMSETFYMRTLRVFLDRVCLDNFGWFYSSLGRAWSSQYMNQWDITRLAACLMKFSNCNEEQVFEAVITYCRSKAEFDQLVPGLYQSCGGYLRYLQSVPRSLKCRRYQ